MQICAVKECGRRLNGDGLCASHQRRWKRTGDPGPAFRRRVLTPVCAGPECVKRPVADDLCGTHYAQRRRGKPLTPIREWLRLPKPRRLADGARLLAEQGGVCAICGGVNRDGRALGQDHDHQCCPDLKRSCGNCRRGLLCHRCNMAIGQFQDDDQLMMKAVAYVRSWRS